MSPGQNSDLRSVLAQNGPLDPARAVGVVRQIAAAIDNAHANRTAHLNITSANILLADDGAAYLSDAGAATPSTERTRVVVTDPEATYRSGIYALTAVLYECITGRPPSPESDADSGAQHRAPVPAGFDEVFARGMASDPNARFSTANELVAAAQGALPMAPRPTPRNQPTSVDAPLPKPSQDVTQTIGLPPIAGSPPGPPMGLPPAPPIRNAERPSWDPNHGRSPTISYPHSRPIPLPLPPQQRQRRRLLAPVLAAVVIVGAVTAGAIVIPRLVRHTPSASSAATKPPAPRTYKSDPIKLPFPGLDRLKNIAIDGAGNIYVLAALVATGEADRFQPTQSHVFKLAPGATTATMLDIPSINFRTPTDMTVDAAGTIYISDHKAVWQLPAGSSSPIRLPFRGFVSIEAIAIDSARNVYAAGPLTDYTDQIKYGLKKLVPGETRPTDVQFPDLYLPHGLAVDKAGNIYVCSSIRGGSRAHVYKLAVGAKAATMVVIPESINPTHVAIDTAGNLFVADDSNKGLFQLPAGSNTSIRVPMAERTTAVAVDPTDTLYVTAMATADKQDRIIKPGEVLKLTPDR